MKTTTAVAFLHFRQQGADWAVIEVALGGRLDATNVVQPQCCVITPIALEKELRFAIREGGRTVGAGVVTEIAE